MKLILASLLGLVMLVLLFFGWSGWPWSIAEKKLTVEVLDVEPEDMVEVEEHPPVIKILTWNLGFLYGQGSEGDTYTYRPREFYQDKLDSLVQQIKDWQPDVICFQEIDFDSSRSHGIDQARYVAEKAGYPYVAEAVSWDANYVPFPYWPIKNNWGSMRSGGAILSRYPIVEHEVLLLRKPKSQAWWYNLFYLHRYFQFATLEIGNKNFRLVNLHLEAFDKEDRQGQIRKLVSTVKEQDLDFVAGDFNMLPVSATKRSKFAQSTDEYENDSSRELMEESQMLEVFPEEIYAKDEPTYFTFPAWAPDRRLDYIFYKKELKMMKAEVLPSALSDHLPIRATFQIDSPKFNPYSQ